MTVSLTDAKAHLNVTFNTDDELIDRLMPVATDWIERQLGYVIATRYPDGAPPALKHAVLMMIAHYYENREGALVGVNAQVLPLGIADIINDYRDWSWSDV